VIVQFISLNPGFLDECLTTGAIILPIGETGSSNFTRARYLWYSDLLEYGEIGGSWKIPEFFDGVDYKEPVF